MSQPITSNVRRKVYCVLSARSLPYAKKAFESLVANCLDDIDLMLITDEAADRDAIVESLQALNVPGRHTWMVKSQREADEQAETVLAEYPNIAAFRFGHPCWRKITDPMLFARADEEMIVLDPDLYFPNYFRFEITPQQGVMLMYQPPHCLLPAEVVERAYEHGIRLAHHTDIGIAQLRNNVDMEWLDGLIGKLGGKSLPRAMHIESIIWAALAMRVGGGYFDPVQWHCWRNSQWKRLLLKAGASGRTLLRAENFSSMKCFHGGGIAKWWIPEALEANELPTPVERLESAAPKPYEELTQAAYESTLKLKTFARRLGYYKVMGS